MNTKSVGVLLFEERKKLKNAIKLLLNKYDVEKSVLIELSNIANTLETCSIQLKKAEISAKELIF